MDNNKIKSMITTGVLLIALGLGIILNDSIIERREKVFSQMNLELTEIFTNEEITETQPEENEEVNQEEQPNQPVENPPVENTPVNPQPVAPPVQTPTVNYETYAGILEIPKIGFNRGFYKKESSLNNVKFNLKILPQSNYPDQEKGNVIIIGHSGNYSNSYFGNLYQLVKGDTASISYNNKKYTYKIVNIYTDSKDGVVTIYRDETKSCLTLITCTKDDDTTQTIYILERISVE